MELFTLAEGIQPFLDKEKKETIESIYRTLLTNQHLSFLKTIVTPKNFPILVFCAYEIYKGNRDQKVLDEIQNNLFFFNFITFGSDVNDIDCHDCGGSGHIDCDNCYGSGQIGCHECDESGLVTCDKCDGDKKETCGECDGTGEYEDGSTCFDCDGSGMADCGECSGSGQMTCPECNGDGEYSCEYCDGDGRQDCNECNGAGTITIYDSIPATIEIYASYSSQLKKNIEMSILKKIEYDSELDIDSNKCLLLFIEELGPDENDSTLILPEFENMEYYGEIEEYEDAYLILNRDKISVSNLELVPDRFMR